MRFESSIYKSLDTIEFRTKDFIYDGNKNGFYIKQGQTKPDVLSIELHSDNHGGIISLKQSISIHEQIRVYYGDRDYINSYPDEHIYSHSTFEDKYTYNGSLGCILSEFSTTFNMWSPLAKEVSVLLYQNSNDNEAFSKIPMSRTSDGVLSATVYKNLDKIYYLYEITIFDKTYTTTDPYAKASSSNSKKSMAIDLSKTDPEGFDKSYHILPYHQTDAIIYEMSIRDFTISPTSGVSDDKKGKFLGFTQENTISPEHEKTSLDHLKELGITHVHLMPVMDFATVNEDRFDHNEYNWGYDPVSYFNLDGSYCSDASDGAVRIYEFKQLVHTLHKNNIGVILDVVYNHTYYTHDSNLNLTMPDYYYRKINGHFSNGSGCGNELDTQKSMARNLIISSIKYWANEFAIDGFRFDLMGLMDTQTSNIIRETLDAIDPRIIMYGEGWTGGASTLPPEAQTTKYNSHKISDRIALFNDEFRDAIKGDTFIAHSPGYVIDARHSDKFSNFVGRIMAGIVAQTPHPSVDYNGHMSPFALSPTQTINYHSAHDNYTLHDKLSSCADWVKDDVLKEIYRLCAGIVLTSQGIPFLMGGEEFMRTKLNPDKSFNHNSYNSPDSVNELNWALKHLHKDIFQYYKGLISLRKTHPIFRIHDVHTLSSSLRFINLEPHNRIGYTIHLPSNENIINEVTVLINPTISEFSINLWDFHDDISNNPMGVFVDKYQASDKILYNLSEQIITIPPVSLMVIGR